MVTERRSFFLGGGGRDPKTEGNLGCVTARWKWYGEGASLSVVTKWKSSFVGTGMGIPVDILGYLGLRVFTITNR